MWFRAVRLISVLFLAQFAAAVGFAATLQQLSMDQMSLSATAIVRARVTGSSASLVGSTIYTHYKLDVTEVWKGSTPSEVMVPGGSLNGTTQTFPGVPSLSTGSEYVLFLWTSASTGINHIVGLTQGLFDVAVQADGSAVASRRETGELMLDSAGRRVSDQSISMKLADLRTRVRQSAANTSTGAAK
jgi:hypothetical protein